MSFTDPPPPYEELSKENQINFRFNSLNYGPDKVYYCKTILFADFIPWCQNTGYNDDLNYLFLRVNDWLHINVQYQVDKCEFIPRMIDSKGKLDLEKCYIFNLTRGRTYFVNQLRLHISIDKSKTEPDKICMKTYIPKANNEKIINISTRNSCLFRFLVQPHQFEEMPSLLNRINKDIKKGIISGVITNISTFYSKVSNDFNSNFKSEGDTMFYTKSSEPKCDLKSLRVFYKPGNDIHGNLGVKSFISNNSTSKTLDDLIENAISFISEMETQNFISMETFPEFEVDQPINDGENVIEDNTRDIIMESMEETRLAEHNNIINHNTTLVFGERLVRFESIKVFYTTDNNFISKPLQNVSVPFKILWIVPKKPKKIFENYNDFMSCFEYLASVYDNDIIDMETLSIPNSLTWSQVRYHTVMRYHNESCTNYEIYAIRLIVKNEKFCHLKKASETNDKLPKYVGFNSIL